MYEGEKENGDKVLKRLMAWSLVFALSCAVWVWLDDGFRADVGKGLFLGFYCVFSICSGEQKNRLDETYTIQRVSEKVSELKTLTTFKNGYGLLGDGAALPIDHHLHGKDVSVVAAVLLLLLNVKALSASVLLTMRTKPSLHAYYVVAAVETLFFLRLLSMTLNSLIKRRGQRRWVETIDNLTEMKAFSALKALVLLNVDYLMPIAKGLNPIGNCYKCVEQFLACTIYIILVLVAICAFVVKADDFETNYNELASAWSAMKDGIEIDEAWNPAELWNLFMQFLSWAGFISQVVHLVNIQKERHFGMLQMLFDSADGQIRYKPTKVGDVHQSAEDNTDDKRKADGVVLSQIYELKLKKCILEADEPFLDKLKVAMCFEGKDLLKIVKTLGALPADLSIGCVKQDDDDKTGCVEQDDDDSDDDDDHSDIDGGQGVRGFSKRERYWPATAVV